MQQQNCPTLGWQKCTEEDGAVMGLTTGTARGAQQDRDLLRLSKCHGDTGMSTYRPPPQEISPWACW